MTLRGGEQFSRKLQELADKIGKTGSYVKVGFLKDATYPDGTQVAAVAAFNEFGTHRTHQTAEWSVRVQNIPPRPFFRNMIAANKNNWSEEIAKILKATKYDGDRTLKLQGKNMEKQLRQSIRDTNSPPLAPSTIAAKGFDKPLVDTGYMLNSVDSEVVT